MTPTINKRTRRNEQEIDTITDDAKHVSDSHKRQKTTEDEAEGEVERSESPAELSDAEVYADAVLADEANSVDTVPAVTETKHSSTEKETEKKIEGEADQKKPDGKSETAIATNIDETLISTTEEGHDVSPTLAAPGTTLPVELAIQEHVTQLLNDSNADGATTLTTEATSRADETTSPVLKKKRGPKMSWQQRFQELLDYKTTNGNCLVPTRYKENPQLGKWVHNQREQYKLFQKPASISDSTQKKKCSITQERIDKLEEAGFVWSTQRSKRQQEDWKQRFEQLTEYKAEHGNCMVPHLYSKDPSLYEWVHRQRVNFASFQKKSVVLEDKWKERFEMLKSIGFSFTKQDDVWKLRLQELEEYKNEFGDCEVPTHYKPNPVLGRWVISQRYEYRKLQKGKKTGMTQDRIDALEALGFDWASGKERQRVAWETRLQELVAYHAQYGHFNVTALENPGLFQWTVEQRSRFKELERKGTDGSKRMGPDRVQALKDIGFFEVAGVSV